MSSAQSPGAYESEKISSKSSWVDGTNNTIFEGRDQVINTLNGTSSEAEISDTLEGGGLDPEGKPESAKDRMTKVSPFGDDSYDVTHEVVTSDNIDTSHADKLLKDENGQNDLEYDENGEIYNMSIHEFFRHPDSTRTGDKDFDRVDRNNLDEVDEDVEVLTVHTVVYEEPSGDKYLVHWDPGRRTKEGRKKKFVEEEGGPSLEAKLKSSGANFFEDYGNYKLDEGLGRISDTLHSMKDKLYREADREMEKNSARDKKLAEAMEAKVEEAKENGMETLNRYKSKLDVEGKELGYSENVREKAWRAERWRGMADAIESFRLSYNSEKPVKKQVSF